MTSTQVQYWSYKENVRHDRATEQLGTDTLTETVRHNKATELLGTNTLKETVRHNQATESISTRSLSESIRHNKATEKENVRHNKRAESISQQQADVARFNAVTNRQVAEANIQKILKDTSMSDAYKLLASRNKGAQRVGAIAVLTEMIADRSQSPNTRAAAQKMLSELESLADNISNSNTSKLATKYMQTAFTTGDGRKMKLIYKGGSWFFVPK